MLYAQDFEQNMVDREESAIDAMTTWLRGQSPDVWMWFAQHANPDTCTPVLSWMVEQPSCDLAVVATIFWNCEPKNLADTLIRGDDRSVVWDEEELAELVLLIWREAPERNSRLQVPTQGRDASYRAFLDASDTTVDPLSVPAWLFGPFGDRPCGATTDRLLADHAHLHRMMCELGVWFGDNPPSQDNDLSAEGMREESPTIAEGLTSAEGLASETPEEKRWRIGFGVALMLLSALALYELMGL